jgi:hypothetical protein
MDARYLKATTVLPPDVKVCGKQLLPFCLRHRVELESIDSPFLDYQKRSFKAIDVIMAVRIMSTFDKVRINAPITLREQFYLIFLNSSRKRLARSVGRILGVIVESCSYPKIWSKKNEKTKENIPWTLSCVANNVRNGCTLEEAWTMPEGEAVWMSISHGIYNGSDIQIVSTDDEAMLDDFDNIINRFKESKKKN